VLERVNVRTLTPEVLRERDPSFEPCSLITADLSFISLVTVVPALCGPLGRPDADLVLLVKPQFEAGRVVVARGKGVVRDPAVWLAGPRTGDVRTSRRRNRHHGGNGFPPDRPGRQRRVPGARPQGRRRDKDRGCRPLMLAASSPTPSARRPPVVTPPAGLTDRH
jgi:hypothetical protein